jgi:hypothetical protein
MKKFYSLIFLFTAGVFGYSQSQQGPLSVGTAQNASCPFSFSSTVGYSPLSGVLASDNVYATVSHCDCCDQNTLCLFAVNFNFSIPGTATINGILAEIEKKASMNAMIQDNGLMLVKAGVPVGNNYATTNNWPLVDTYVSYGSSTDLWGTTWTPADINNPGFGLAYATISYTCFGNGNPAVSSIDHIRMTVFYTNISTGQLEAQSNDPDYLSVFPNPSRAENLNIVSPALNGNALLEIFDAGGKRVFKKGDRFSGGVFSLEPLQLPKGFYSVRITTSEKVLSHKFIIQ